MRAIVCVDKKWGIGYQGDQLFYIADDLKRFKSLTSRSVVIYGRKTQVTFPQGKPLANRINICLSKSQTVDFASQLTELRAGKVAEPLLASNIEQLQQLVSVLKEQGYVDNDFWVIGGSSVYELLMPYIDEIYVTQTEATFTADRYFPNLFYLPEWELKDKSELLAENELNYRYLNFARQELRLERLHLKSLSDPNISQLLVEVWQASAESSRSILRDWRKQKGEVWLIKNSYDQLLGLITLQMQLAKQGLQVVLYPNQRWLQMQAESPEYRQKLAYFFRQLASSNLNLRNVAVQLIAPRAFVLRSADSLRLPNFYFLGDAYQEGELFYCYKQPAFFLYANKQLLLFVEWENNCITGVKVIADPSYLTEQQSKFLQENGLLHANQIDQNQLQRYIGEQDRRYANHLLLKQVKAQLDDYFAGKRKEFKLPLAQLPGNEFQKAVWQEIKQIPYGSTCSYSELAKRILQHSTNEFKQGINAKRKASHYARAVGNCCKQNPFELLVPCHRVIGKDRNIRGYAGGVDAKAELLQLELIHRLDLLKEITDNI